MFLCISFCFKKLIQLYCQIKLGVYLLVLNNTSLNIPNRSKQVLRVTNVPRTLTIQTCTVTNTMADTHGQSNIEGRNESVLNIDVLCKKIFTYWLYNGSMHE